MTTVKEVYKTLKAMIKEGNGDAVLIARDNSGLYHEVSIYGEVQHVGDEEYDYDSPPVLEGSPEGTKYTIIYT